MLFQTIEFANKAENKYFVGTRYDEARLKVRTDLAKNSFYYNGSVIFNKLNF